MPGYPDLPEDCQKIVLCTLKQGVLSLEEGIKNWPVILPLQPSKSLAYDSPISAQVDSRIGSDFEAANKMSQKFTGHKINWEVINSYAYEQQSWHADTFPDDIHFSATLTSERIKTKGSEHDFSTVLEWVWMDAKPKKW